MRQEQPPDERFIVEFSEQCEADLDTCYLRLSRASPEVAARWQKGILAACFSLSQFPRRCTIAPEAQSFGREVRLLLYRNRRTVYRILYAIFDATEDASGEIRILRVRQGARQASPSAGYTISNRSRRHNHYSQTINCGHAAGKSRARRERLGHPR